MTETPKTELERLEALEWAGEYWTHDGGVDCCPVCGWDESSNHYSDCWLAARIAELREASRSRDHADADLALELADCSDRLRAALHYAWEQGFRHAEKSDYDPPEPRPIPEWVENPYRRVAEESSSG